MEKIDSVGQRKEIGGKRVENRLATETRREKKKVKNKELSRESKLGK